MVLAVGRGREAPIGRERGAAHHGTERAPGLVARHRDRDPALVTAAGEDAVRRHGGMAVPARLQRQARRHLEQAGPRVGRDRLDLGEVDVLTLTRRRAMLERGQGAERGVQSRDHVAESEGRSHRIAAGESGLGRQARQRGERVGVRQVIPPRARVAEPRHGDGNDVGLDRSESGVIETPPRHDPRTEVFDHHVRVGHQPGQDVAPGRDVEIERHASLAAVVIVEIAVAIRIDRGMAREKEHA